MEGTARTGMSPVKLGTFISVWHWAHGFKFGNWPYDEQSAIWGFLLPGVREEKAVDGSVSRSQVSSSFFCVALT